MNTTTQTLIGSRNIQGFALIWSVLFWFLITTIFFCKWPTVCQTWVFLQLFSIFLVLLSFSKLLFNRSFLLFFKFHHSICLWKTTFFMENNKTDETVIKWITNKVVELFSIIEIFVIKTNSKFGQSLKVCFVSAKSEISYLLWSELFFKQTTRREITLLKCYNLFYTGL